MFILILSFLFKILSKRCGEGFVKFVNNRKASEMNEGRDSVKRRRETWRLRRSVSEAGEAADRTRTARTFQQNPGLRKMRKPGMTLKPQRLAQSEYE